MTINSLTIKSFALPLELERDPGFIKKGSFMALALKKYCDFSAFSRQYYETLEKSYKLRTKEERKYYIFYESYREFFKWFRGGEREIEDCRGHYRTGSEGEGKKKLWYKSYLFYVEVSGKHFLAIVVGIMEIKKLKSLELDLKKIKEEVIRLYKGGAVIPGFLETEGNQIKEREQFQGPVLTKEAVIEDMIRLFKKEKLGGEIMKYLGEALEIGAGGEDQVALVVKGLFKGVRAEIIQGLYQLLREEGVFRLKLGFGKLEEGSSYGYIYEEEEPELGESFFYKTSTAVAEIEEIEKKKYVWKRIVMSEQREETMTRSDWKSLAYYSYGWDDIKLEEEWPWGYFEEPGPRISAMEYIEPERKRRREKEEEAEREDQ